MSFMERFLKMLCTKRPCSRLTAYTRLLSTFNISIWGMMRSIKNEWKSLSFLHCHKQESLSAKVLLASILLSSRVIRLVKTRLYSNVKLKELYPAAMYPWKSFCSRDPLPSQEQHTKFHNRMCYRKRKSFTCLGLKLSRSTKCILPAYC